MKLLECAQSSVSYNYSWAVFEQCFFFTSSVCYYNVKVHYCINLFQNKYDILDIIIATIDVTLIEIH